MKSVHYFLLIIMCLLFVACTSEPNAVPTIVEVMKEVQIPITQIVTVEITREVEVTRVVQKEVTREVVIQSTSTPIPQENDPSAAFAMNFLGIIEQDGIKVELARIVFIQRDALKPDLNFDDDTTNLYGDEYLGEIIWRISNNTSQSIRWSYDDINVRVNDRQIKLYDYLFYNFGENPADPIFPGSTIIGGVWFGIGNIKPNEITSISLLFGKPYDPDTYNDISGNFILTADLSGEHKWYPMPEELK